MLKSCHWQCTVPKRRRRLYPRIVDDRAPWWTSWRQPRCAMTNVLLTTVRRVQESSTSIHVPLSCRQPCTVPKNRRQPCAKIVNDCAPCPRVAEDCASYTFPREITWFNLEWPPLVHHMLLIFDAKTTWKKFNSEIHCQSSNCNRLFLKKWRIYLKTVLKILLKFFAHFYRNTLPMIYQRTTPEPILNYFNKFWNKSRIL